MNFAANTSAFESDAVVRRAVHIVISQHCIMTADHVYIRAASRSEKSVGNLIVEEPERVQTGQLNRRVARSVGIKSTEHQMMGFYAAGEFYARHAGEIFLIDGISTVACVYSV